MSSIRAESVDILLQDRRALCTYKASTGYAHVGGPLSCFPAGPARALPPIHPRGMMGGSRVGCNDAAATVDALGVRPSAGALSSGAARRGGRHPAVVVVCDTCASLSASTVTRPRRERCHTMALQVSGVTALAGELCDRACVPAARWSPYEMILGRLQPRRVGSPGGSRRAWGRGPGRGAPGPPCESRGHEEQPPGGDRGGLFRVCRAELCFVFRAGRRWPPSLLRIRGNRGSPRSGRPTTAQRQPWVHVATMNDPALEGRQLFRPPTATIALPGLGGAWGDTHQGLSPLAIDGRPSGPAAYSRTQRLGTTSSGPFDHTTGATAGAGRPPERAPRRTPAGPTLTLAVALTR